MGSTHGSNFESEGLFFSVQGEKICLESYRKLQYKMERLMGNLMQAEIVCCEIPCRIQIASLGQTVHLVWIHLFSTHLLFFAEQITYRSGHVTPFS